MFEARRTGLASLLFAILHPRRAEAASVTGETLRLTFPFQSADIPLGDVEAVDVAAGRRWSGLRIRHAAGTSHVSGLPRLVASALAGALETARRDWWRRALGPRIGSLRAVRDRLAELADPQKYFAADALRDLEAAARAAAGGLAPRWPTALSDAPEIRMLREALDFLEDPSGVRAKANAAFVANELIRSRSLFDRIETWPLTAEQRRAVVVDERRNLVVAPAGSGKTSVLVAKAGWLVRRMRREPSELLLLAFARDARKEMEERLRARLGAGTARGMTVRTFHSLGMAIIGEAEGRRPGLARVAESERALFDLLKGIVADLLGDRKLSAILQEWFQNRFASYRSEHQFRSWGEYYDYIRTFDIRSLQGETVRSFEACEIANFLYLDGVAYEYEAPYEHDLATQEKRQYKPDFHLPEHGIYIEHFGIDAAGNTAPFVDRETYVRDMDWKRGVHAGHDTVLIETFSHEHSGGRLLRNLARRIAAHGVTFAPIPRGNVFSVLEQQGRIDPFTRLVAAFLRHFKGAGLSFSDLAARAREDRGRARAQAFLAVFRPIFERYRAALAEFAEIDFHDMISRAADLVESGRYRSPFGYILVDEFQNISPERARLLKALLDSSPGAQLFAVGDDWQTIYRFGGSDIAIMREFGDQFEAFERIDLETTFRCCDHITAVATDFCFAQPRADPQDGPRDAQGRRSGRACGSAGRARAPTAEGSARPDHGGCPPARRDVRGPAAGPLPAPAAPRHGPAAEAVSGPSLFVDDSASLQGPRGRLCRGPRPVLRQARVSRRGCRRLAAGPRPGGARAASERRGAAPALRRHHARQAAGLPAGRRRPAVRVRQGAARGRVRRLRVRPRAGRGRALSALQRGTAGTPRGCRRRKRLLRLLELPLCQHTARACPICRTGLPVGSGGAYRCRDCGGTLEGCPACGGWLDAKMGRFGRFLGCSNWPDCDYTRDLRQPQGGRGLA